MPNVQWRALGLVPSTQTARNNDATRATFLSDELLNPFAQGAFRWVAEGTYTEGNRAGEPCVCKWFKTGSVFEEEFFASDIHAVQKAEQIITKFNNAGFIDKTILLNIPEVWTFDEDSGDWAGQKVLQEPMIDDWQKFNSNSGWADVDDPWSRVMQALSHFSFHTTGGEFVLCDLQGGFCGGGVVLSDPVINSRRKQYGVTDLGKAGISSFFSRHRCNEFCRPHWTKPCRAVAHFPSQQSTTMISSHNFEPQKATHPQSSSLQAYADGAAARTPAEKKADGENTVKVENAVKKALGGTAKVIRAGSNRKGVDIAGSDIDLLVDTKDPVTHDQKKLLTACLKKVFPGTALIDLHYTCIRVNPTQGRDIDVVLRHVPGHIKPVPREHFKYNTGARTAIRAFKQQLAQQGQKVKGIEIESKVIQFTQGHPGCKGKTIYNHLQKTLSQGKLKALRKFR
eukprot:1827896-Rhodomonas_salina.1